MTVSPAALSRVTLDPARVTVAPTQVQTFDVTALYEFDNSVSDLTFTFKASSQAGRMHDNGTFSAGTTVGVYEDGVTVEVTQGTVTATDTADITIEPGPLAHVTIVPSAPTLEVTERQTFTATPLDEFNNPIDGLLSTFQADARAGQVFFWQCNPGFGIPMEWYRRSIQTD